MLERKMLYDLYVVQKMPLKDIAVYFGVSRSTVSDYVKKYDFPRRIVAGKSHYGINKESLYELYVVQKKPITTIAAIYGVDRALIGYYSRKYGFPKRNKKPIVRREGECVGDWILIRKFICNHHTIWECRCKCGVVCNVRVSSLNQNKSKCCKKCGMQKTQDIRIVPWYNWNKVLMRAKRKNIPIDITHEYLEDIWDQQLGRCALSGLALKFARGWTEKTQGKTTASLDRIDSTKGYVVGNVQWVHKAINNMKQSFTQQQFLYFCRAVADYKKDDVEIDNDARNSEILHIRKHAGRFGKQSTHQGNNT